MAMAIIESAALFSRLEESLSISLVDQAKTSFALAAFSSLTRRNHYLKFASLLPDSQKSRLLGSNPFSPDLFENSVVDEIVKDYESGQATSSHINMSKAVAKGLLSLGKRKNEQDASSQGPGGKSPVGPPNAGSQPDSANSNARGGNYRGRYNRRGGAQYGRGNYRGRGAPQNQKAPAPAKQDFTK